MKTFKKSLCLLLAVCLLLSAAPLSVLLSIELPDWGFISLFSSFSKAEKNISSGICGDNLTWELNNEGLLTISGNGPMFDYNDYPHAPWLNGVNANIKRVIIENGVTNIGNYAFYYCTLLSTVSIPDSVVSIGDFSFQACAYSLSEVFIPNSVKSIGKGAFYGCFSLQSVLIPESVKSIGSYAFYDCRGVKEFEIKNGVEIIGKQAFDFVNYYGESVTIPRSVRLIEDGAFVHFPKLKKFIVDEANKFYVSLDGILYDKNMTKLIKYPNGKAVESFAIPDGIERVCDCCFYMQIGLKNVVFPKSLLSIGDSAFYYTGLTNVTIPDSVTSIGSYAFSTSINLKDVYYSGSSKQWDSVNKNGNLTNVDIHFNSTGPDDVHDGEYYNYSDQDIIEEELKDYTVIAGTLNSYVLSVVLNAKGQTYVSEFTVDGVSYAVEGNDTSEDAILKVKNKPIFIALKDNKIVWFSEVENYISEPFVEVEMPTFEYSTSRNKYLSDTKGNVIVKVSNPLLSYVEPARGFSTSIFSTYAFRKKLEDSLEEKDFCSLQLKNIMLSSNNDLLNPVETDIDTNAKIRVGKTMEFVFPIQAFETPNLKASQNFSVDNFTATVTLQNGEKLNSLKGCFTFNADYRPPVKPWEQKQPENGSSLPSEIDKTATEAAKQLRANPISLGGDTSQSLRKIFSPEQLEAIANTIYTIVAMYKAPKDTFRNSLSNEIIEKMFNCNTSLVTINSYEIACTFAVDTSLGIVQVQFSCDTTDTALNGIRYSYFGKINYKILNGPKKLLKDIQTEGFAGLLADADMKAFCKAAWSVALAELKSAYNKAYGNDLNKAVDIVFGKSVNEILSRTKYGSVSGLFWKMLITPSAKIIIECPVDVYVYNNKNELVASIVNNQVTLTTDDAAATVEDGVKKLQLFDDDYRVEYIPFADGTMDICIENYGTSDGLIEKTELRDVPLQASTSYLQNVNNGITKDKDYSLLSSDGVSIPVDNNESAFHDHVSDGVIYNKEEPTCNQEGYTWGYCTKCGEYYIMSVVPALPHTWRDGEITEAATCTTSGTKTFVCSVCGSIKTEEIAPTGHAVVIDKAVAATCTTEGKTEGSHCSVCNEVIKTPTVIKATGHKLTKIAKKAATCTAAGNVEYYTCSVCKKTFSDAKGTKEIKDVTVRPTGHKAVTDAAVAATCTKDGKTEGSHCSVCGEVLKAQTVVKATGHKWDNGKITTAATCTKDGVKTYTCTVCKTTKTEPVKATGHKAVTNAAVAATCTKDGKTEGSHCSVCGTVLKAQTVVKATGHKWDDGKVTTEPTQTKEGVKTYTCTVCGATRKESVAKLPEPEKPAYLPGDVDNDGSVTAADARLALRGAVGLETYAPGSAEFTAADVDKSGDLTAADARLILRAAVGLEELAA